MKLRVYNDTLDPNIWNEDKSLKSDVKDALLKISEDFYNSTDLTGDIQNILFLGSVANYNYTPSSDIDLHIVIDISSEKINDEYTRAFMDGLSLKWNTDHDIEIKGHPVEVYIQDVRDPNSTVQQARPNVAIYSIFDDKWMIEPNKLKIDLDAEKIREKYQTLKEKIKNLVETEDIEKLKDLMKSIRNYRDAGLSKGGEFSVENLVFKALRHTGELKTMKNAINTIYDKKVSLPEDGNIQPDKKTEPLKENLIDKNSGLFLGFIKRDNLKVVGTSLSNEDVSDVYSHNDFKKELGDEWLRLGSEEFIPWRYKPAKNTIYWWAARLKPDEDEKEAVEYWVEKNAISKHPLLHKQIGNFDIPLRINRDDSHTIDEGDRQPFLVVGIINDDLDITSKIDYIGYTKGEPDCEDDMTNAVSHESFFGRNNDIKWRYKSKTNTIHWYDKDSSFGGVKEKHKDSVSYYLNKKYGVINPKHSKNFYTYCTQGHFINESEKQPFLIVGNVNDDLEVRAEIDYKGAQYYHWKMGVTHKWTGGINWRYKSKTNTIYWGWDNDKLNEKQKDAVLDYLHNKFNVINPKNVGDAELYLRQGHFINEEMSNFLIIGCINDELEILAKNDLVGDVSHEELLNKNKQYHYNPSTVIFWRYKSVGNVLYWGDGATDKQREVVLEYLKKINIENPRQAVMNTSIGAFDNSHRINEMVSLVKLFMAHPLLIKK